MASGVGLGAGVPEGVPLGEPEGDGEGEGTLVGVPKGVGVGGVPVQTDNDSLMPSPVPTAVTAGSMNDGAGSPPFNIATVPVGET